MTIDSRRAENIGAVGIEQRNIYTTELYKAISEYLGNGSSFNILEIKGERGSGKTFTTLKALNEKIRTDPDFIPIIIVFAGKEEFQILEPEKIATEAEWGGRYRRLKEKFEEVKTFRDIPKVLEISNCIILDDFGYLFEYIKRLSWPKGSEKKRVLKRFISGFIWDIVNFIEDNKIDKRVNTIFISNESIEKYSRLMIDGAWTAIKDIIIEANIEKKHITELIPRVSSVSSYVNMLLRNKVVKTPRDIEVIEAEMGEIGKLDNIDFFDKLDLIVGNREGFYKKGKTAYKFLIELFRLEKRERDLSERDRKLREILKKGLLLKRDEEVKEEIETFERKTKNKINTLRKLITKSHKRKRIRQREFSENSDECLFVLIEEFILREEVFFKYSK